MARYARFHGKRAGVDTIISEHKNKGVASQPLCFYGGSEENRTPVRKPIHTTFFVDSLLFEFPVRRREQTRSAIR